MLNPFYNKLLLESCYNFKILYKMLQIILLFTLLHNVFRLQDLARTTAIYFAFPRTVVTLKQKWYFVILQILFFNICSVQHISKILWGKSELPYQQQK